VLELFSYTNSSSTLKFPDSSELWVRFYFRNGTGDSVDSDANDSGSNTLQSYPLFGNGPSQTDITWDDFETSMYAFVVGDIGDWCMECSATNTFCAAWNTSDGFTDTTGTPSTHKSSVSPVVAGVIGAVVTLAVIAKILILVMFFGGIRFRRVEHRKKSDLGGFKGSRKLASDQDLTIPKGGATVGATVESSPTSPIVGHERVGSWELKEAEAGRKSDALSERRMSEDGEHFREPVKPDERV
jgi:hypothetical protein